MEEDGDASDCSKGLYKEKWKPKARARYRRDVAIRTGAGGGKGGKRLTKVRGHEEYTEKKRTRESGN